MKTDDISPFIYSVRVDISNNISSLYFSLVGRDGSVGIVPDYGLGGPGSNPGGGETFRTCSDLPWSPPSFLYNGYRGFPRGKERPGCDADPSPLLMPWSRKSRAIPLLPLWPVRSVHSLSACTRVNLYLFFPFY